MRMLECLIHLFLRHATSSGSQSPVSRAQRGLNGHRGNQRGAVPVGWSGPETFADSVAFGNPSGIWSAVCVLKCLICFFLDFVIQSQKNFCEPFELCT